MNGFGFIFWDFLDKCGVFVGFVFLAPSWVLSLVGGFWFWLLYACCLFT